MILGPSMYSLRNHGGRRFNSYINPGFTVGVESGPQRSIFFVIVPMF